MTKRLSIKGITKSYKKGTIKANSNITLELEPNEITALVGHNGAGKTTLLQQIIGNVRPDAGVVEYDEYDFSKNTSVARELTALMPQLHAPLRGVTVKQALAATLKIKGLSKSDIDKLTNQILQELKIEKWKNVPGEKLSGGLQRLTSFAMIVCSPPPIILLDEPTNDVDPIRRKIIWEYLKKLSVQGHVVIVITHNLLEVEQYADRYILMDRGQVIKDQRLSDAQLLETSVLELSVRQISPDMQFPEEVEVTTFTDELKYELSFSKDQLPVVMEWLLEQMQQKLVVNYDLHPKSMIAMYGSDTNEE